jgi:uncharacterized protein YkwD
MRPIDVAIALITLTASAHAVEQNIGVLFNPDARQIIYSPDNVLEVPIAPVVASVIVPIDSAPIEAPPLPRPRPALRDAISDNPAALISAFRHQHGEGSVAISGTLTHIAQEQANTMAGRDLLDHNAAAPFSSRTVPAISNARLRISLMAMLISLTA